MPGLLILLTCSLLLPFVLLCFTHALCDTMLRDLRIPRILHYVSLAGMGIALYGRNNSDWLRPERIVTYLLFVVALTYAAVFAIVTNNIADLEADRYSNRDRPLVQGIVDGNLYLVAGIFCLCVALGLSLLVSIVMFWGVVGISAGYFLYSCPPFRLKKIPLLAKLLIGLNSLTVSLTGFVLAGGKLANFPLIWIIFIVIPLSLSANFVDLKDTEGHGKTGVRTLPVLFGPKKAKWFIAFFTICTYVMGGVLLNIAWVYPLMVVLAVLHIWFLFNKPYKEQPVFLVYLTALFGLDLFLFFSETLF